MNEKRKEKSLCKKQIQSMMRYLRHGKSETLKSRTELFSVQWEEHPFLVGWNQTILTKKRQNSFLKEQKTM